MHLDIETFSECALDKEGTYRYAAHTSTRVLCVAYLLSGQTTPSLWVCGERYPRVALPDADTYVGMTPPEDLQKALDNPEERLWAWNAEFERVVLSGIAGKAINFPAVPLERWRCSMALGAYYGVPRALSAAAAACGGPLKDSEGSRTMLALSKPRRPSKSDPNTYWAPEKHPDKYVRVFEYCIDDVRAEHGVHATLGPWPEMEEQLWLMDQQANSRGIRIDTEAVDCLHAMSEEYKAELSETCKEITGYSVTQRTKLLDWLNNHGCNLTDMQALTVDDALLDADGDVKKVLYAYRVCNQKALAKLPRIKSVACDDNRVRGLFTYYGAHTGRWSSRIVQFQNMKAPPKSIYVPNLILDFGHNANLNIAKQLWPTENVMDILSSALRGVFIADEDSKLLCIDFAQIEARMLAWLAGQESTLQVFRDDLDLYQNEAASIFGVDYDKVTRHQRAQGKVAVLALGYQGWVGAFRKFLHGTDLSLSDREIVAIAKHWRRRNSRVVDLWKQTENRVCRAVRNEGSKQRINGHLSAVYEKPRLKIRLPSGRCIHYLNPEIGKDSQMRYEKGLGGKVMRDTTYGGKLVENITQAVARDCMVAGLFNLGVSCKELTLLGTVHDEAVFNMPLDKARTTTEYAKLFCTMPSWYTGPELKAEPFTARRYRK